MLIVFANSSRKDLLQGGYEVLSTSSSDIISAQIHFIWNNSMQGKKDNILSFDEWELITSFLPARDVFNLSRLTKSSQSFFKPMLDEQKKIHQFLQHVVRAEYEAIETMMQEDPSLMLKKGKVTDEAGRTFENISGFNYACWAHSKHTWACMIDSIPKDTKNRLNLLEQALAQYDDVNTKGVTYTLNQAQVAGEKHFDMENTIIKELQIQVDSVNNVGEKNWVIIDRQWREGVGRAQKIFTAEIVDFYCSDVSFYPTPDVTSRPQSNKQFYNSFNDVRFENWFNPNSRLGFDFAIYKNCWLQRAGAARRVYERVGSYELDAVKALYKARREDFISLRPQLEELITEHKQSRVCQK